MAVLVRSLCFAPLVSAGTLCIVVAANLFAWQRNVRCKSNLEESMEFSTRAIHAGQEPDPTTGATVTPLYLTSVYSYETIEEYAANSKGYDYGRHGNPTRTAMETCLATLEGAEHAIGFASGMAAIDAALRLLHPGDHLLLAEDIYGGTYRLVEQVFRPAGIEASYVDAREVDSVAAGMRPNTRMVWIETPTNPLVRLVDIAAISELTRAHGTLLAVDNTFATPYFQNPLALGADIVMHSTTKYLGGHSDLVGGALVFNSPELKAKINLLSKITGATPSPFDCWLTLRGMKTLAVRMREHERNALALARFLEEHPKVAEVHYPGLPWHPQHDLARRQMRGFGGMVAVELKGGGEAARSVLNSVKIFTLTGSLGGVESILSYPKEMSHIAFTPEERSRMGIEDGLIRLSIGLEDAADLIEDLSQALEKAAG
jgi:cystathionine beta-lyase/cystathionine gamma-synthase